MYSFLVPDAPSYHASALSPTPHCREKHGDTSSQIAPRFIGSDSVLSSGLRAAEPQSSEPREKTEKAVYNRTDWGEGSKPFILPGRGH